MFVNKGCSSNDSQLIIKTACIDQNPYCSLFIVCSSTLFHTFFFVSVILKIPYLDV